MNASTVLVLVEWHKLEPDAATALQLALGHYVNRTRVLLAQTLYLNSGWLLGNVHWWSCSYKHWRIYCMGRLQPALCGGGGGVYQAQTLYLH